MFCAAEALAFVANAEFDTAGFSSVVFMDVLELHAAVTPIVKTAAVNAVRVIFEGMS